jgi:hypothetical protein
MALTVRVSKVSRVARLLDDGVLVDNYWFGGEPEDQELFDRVSSLASKNAIRSIIELLWPDRVSATGD